MEDLVKHIRSIQFFVVVFSLAVLVSTVTDTTTKQERAYDQLLSFRAAVERWNLSRFDIRESVYADLLANDYFSEITSDVPQRLPPSALLGMAEEMNAETEDSAMIADFLSRWARRAEKRGFLVLKRTVKLYGGSYEGVILMDPIGCVAGQKSVATKGDIEPFWRDLSEPNDCYVFKGLVDEIDFNPVPPQFQFNVLGATAHSKVVLLAGDVAKLFDQKEAGPSHQNGAGPPTTMMPVIFNMAILGGADGRDGSRLTRVDINGSARAEFIRIPQPPLLLLFGAKDGEANWVTGGMKENFPDLTDIIKDYPAGIDIGDLDEVMRLNAEQDIEQINALGISIPASAITLVGLPLIAATLLYFLAHIKSFVSAVNVLDERSTIVWLGAYGGTFNRLLFIATAVGLPSTVVLARTVVAARNGESTSVLAVAVGATLVVVWACYEVLKTHYLLHAMLSVGDGPGTPVNPEDQSDVANTTPANGNTDETTV